MSQSQSDIRGVLMQLTGARLLLPNATMAEVLSYATPEPIADAPDWLLGSIRWRGYTLPLVAFAQLAGFGRERADLRCKVVVLKALGGRPQLPYFALLTQGFPRLVTVSRDALQADGEGEALPLAVHSRVQLNLDDALVPDLPALEGMIEEAVRAREAA